MPSRLSAGLWARSHTVAGGTPVLLASVAVVAVLPAAMGASWTSVAVPAALFALTVIGLDIVAGYAGQTSLGHNGFMAIGAYAVAISTVTYGWSFGAGLVLAIVVSAASALMLGWFAIRLRGEVYLALATFGFGLAVVSILSAWPTFTGGPSGLTGLPAVSIAGYELTSDGQLYWFVWSLAIVVAICVRALAGTNVGLRWRTVAASSDLAEACGIDSRRVKVSAFCLSAAIAGMAGGIYAAYLSAVAPETFGTPLLITLLAIHVLGGARSAYGPLLGAIVATLITTYSGAAAELSELTFGILFVLALALLPRGLAGVLTSVSSWRRPRPQGGLPAAAEAVPSAPREDMQPAADVSAGAPVLEVVGIDKSFGGLRAVSGATLSARRGQIVGLVGPNGAGKSTLLNIISGLDRADRGEIRFSGTRVTAWRPWRRARTGVTRTFQTPRLVESLSILDNVALGLVESDRRGTTRARTPRRRREQHRALARSLCDELHLGLPYDAPCTGLSFGQARLVEFARAALGAPRLICLDEPMSGLSPEERQLIADLLRRCAQRGASVLLVEHDMEMVRSTCDWVYVLDQGRIIHEDAGSEVFKHEGVVTAYLGAGD
jgi:branched-chain amino acid transport system permease protein